ncbi:hypothetical protein Q2K19_28385 [Micromonospora soli]|uniref:hypothetical protein n=1 Tax=Micromonospora sp. NBRC 110009 TaxID=3061627 RepID=UPI002671F3A7|nr:hypothetical protein [Micromonospora sp. NBRC 110009]WKT98044.1 hypothetical protein Q2K19_28385 [Micromonospora sp. NBRC 110009]
MGARVRVALASVVLLAGCTTGSRPAAAPAGPPGAAAATGCAARVETGALPDWARAGFSGDARMPHVLGAHGDIVAALFAHPLAVERADGSNNKILWVARPVATSPATTAPATLEITATLDGTDTRVTREVAGGPGPSIIDLPRAGCWHLVLRWSGRTDTMDLVYADS